MSTKKVVDMDYRQWLIGMAMQGLLASDPSGDLSTEKCASASIRYADGVLKALDEERPKRNVGTFL